MSNPTHFSVEVHQCRAGPLCRLHGPVSAPLRTPTVLPSRLIHCHGAHRRPFPPALRRRSGSESWRKALSRRSAAGLAGLPGVVGPPAVVSSREQYISIRLAVIEWSHIDFRGGCFREGVSLTKLIFFFALRFLVRNHFDSDGQSSVGCWSSPPHAGCRCAS